MVQNGRNKTTVKDNQQEIGELGTIKAISLKRLVMGLLLR
jgi:hypothetical protein